MIYKLKIARRVPVTVQWIFELWFIYFIIFTLFRVITLFLFKPAAIPLNTLLPSFLLGFQYDVKWIAIILLPIALLSIYKKFSRFILKLPSAYGHITLPYLPFLYCFFLVQILGTSVTTTQE